MKKLLLAALIFAASSCAKDKITGDQDEYDIRCGTLITTPVLDSFVAPTYYISAIVAFKEGNEVVHFHGNVTGDHDGSWYLPRYSKDSIYCTDPVKK